MFDYKILHEQAKINTNRKQSNAKEYTDQKGRTRNIETSMRVLVKQARKNKYSTVFDPVPLLATRVMGNMATAWQRPNLTITRNILYFKRFFSRDEDIGEPMDDHSESDLKDDGEDQTRGNEQQEHETRNPV